MKSLKLILLIAIFALVMNRAHKKSSSKSLAKLRSTSKTHHMSKADAQYCTDLKTDTTAFFTNIAANKGLVLEIKGTGTDASIATTFTYSILLKLNAFSVSNGKCSVDCGTDTEYKSYVVQYDDFTIDATSTWRFDYTASGASTSTIIAGGANFTWNTNTFINSKTIDSRATNSVTASFALKSPSAITFSCLLDTEYTSQRTAIGNFILKTVAADTQVAAKLKSWFTTYKSSANVLTSQS
jgi:hypothetical protein